MTVTSSERPAEREAVLWALGFALAAELACMWRYRRHHALAAAWNEAAAAAEFSAQAWEKQLHAGRLAERIVQLDGQPKLDGESRSGPAGEEPVDGTTLVELIGADLVAEYIVIDTFGEALRRLGDRDPTSRSMLEELVAAREALCLRLQRDLRVRSVPRAGSRRRAPARFEANDEQPSIDAASSPGIESGA